MIEYAVERQPDFFDHDQAGSTMHNGYGTVS